MHWVSLGQKGGLDTSTGSSEDLNRRGSWLGAMAQANKDVGPDLAPPPSDRRTAEALGRRVALATNAGRAAASRPRWRIGTTRWRRSPIDERTMGVFYGLTAAVCFGLADFFATRAARRVGVLRTLLAVQVVGLLAMAIVVAVVGQPPAAAPAAWAAMLGVGGVNFVGMVLLYRAFAIGTLSLVSPIASGFAVVTAGLALATGERPPGLALAGSALLVFGVGVVSRTRGQGSATLAGVPEAVAVTFCFGLYYWALGELTPQLGVFWPVLVTRLVQLLLALVAVRWWAAPAPIPLRPNLPLFVAAGLLDTTALIAFNLGVDRAYTTTTTALAALYSVVTVVLAWAILRERLAPGQWAGVAVVLAGVLLVSV